MAQIKDYQKQADDNRIEIHYDQKDVIVNADKARITQVIANLLRNAINFTEGGGPISITANTNNQQVIISIRDTGSGISPEIYPKLFTKFVTKSEKGTVLDCSYQGASWKRTEAGYGLKTTRRIMGPHLLLHCSLFGIVEDKIIFKPKTLKLDLVNPVV